MRKINALQILVFACLLSTAIVLAIGTTTLTAGRLQLGDFRGVTLVLVAVLLIYAYAFLIHRLFFARWPLLPGEVPPASRQEFIYHIDLLFYLLLFNPLINSGIVPVPLMRLIYQALGARLGSNTYSAGIIRDPHFVLIGRNCIVGQLALLIPHAIEGSRLAHYPIVLGDNVTIGAHAIVFSDVIIGNNAIVAAGAVVPEGSRIGPGETWGGVPARPLKLRQDAPAAG